MARLGKIAQELNISVITVIDFLNSHGYQLDETNANMKVTEEQEKLLLDAFNNDKLLKKKVEHIVQERKQVNGGYISREQSQRLSEAIEKTKIEQDKIEREKIIEQDKIEREKIAQIEREKIAQMTFVDECKKIVHDITAQIIEKECANFDFSFSYFPDINDLYTAVQKFIDSEQEICIDFTYVYIDGYTIQHWKWDGSEYDDVGPSSFFWCESTNNFLIKNICIEIGYKEQFRTSTPYTYPECNDDIEIIKVKNTPYVAVRINEQLKNKEQIYDIINKKIHTEKQSLIDSLKEKIFDLSRQILQEKLYEYLKSTFPIYGHTLAKYICESNATKLFNFLYFAKERVDTNAIKEIMLSAFISNQVDKYRIFSQDLEINFPHVKYQNGMILSMDGTILYRVFCKWQNIVIPESVKIIYNGAFNDCNEIKEILFLGKITKIDHAVFTCPVNNIENDVDLPIRHYHSLADECEIKGDFSELSFFGYNSSLVELTIKNDTKKIIEWSYLFNKNKIDTIKINTNKKHYSGNSNITREIL